MVLNARCRVIVVGCGVLSILARGAVAEESPRLELGAWVRVSVDGQESEAGDAQRFEGSVVDFSDTTLALGRDSGADEVVIAREQIALLEERVQKGRRLRNLAIGFVAGAAVGVAFGLLAGDDPECEGAWCYGTYSARDKALMAATLLAPTVAILAAIAAPGEKWEVVPLEGDGFRVDLGVSAAGHVFIAASF